MHILVTLNPNATSDREKINDLQMRQSINCLILINLPITNKYLPLMERIPNVLIIWIYPKGCRCSGRLRNQRSQYRTQANLNVTVAVIPFGAAGANCYSHALLLL
jgi:hypothetical protein